MAFTRDLDNIRNKIKLPHCKLFCRRKITENKSGSAQYPPWTTLIRKHTIDLFSAGSGAAVHYAGRDMVTTHTGMNITAAEYMHVVDDILGVLNHRQIDDISKNEVLAILWSLKGMIIGK